MRLGALLLIPAALAAQPNLPWDQAGELPWETAVPEATPEPLLFGKTDGETLRVVLSGDGTLRLADERGRVVLRLGLPGRPVRLLRDAGTPVALADFPTHFPAETPLRKGLGNLPLAVGDFRAALEGLLWILDDGDRCITVLHPATRQVVYLPLPPGANWDLHFRPDRLEIREQALPGAERQETACWSLPWLALLPQFVRLSVPAPAETPGTAFKPFP